MTGSRLNWNQRQSPTDMDQIAPTAETFEFDISRPFPEKVNGKRVGPSLITNALKKGFYVLCAMDDIPGVWAVESARWQGEVLEVLTLQGYRIPSRVWTATTLKGIKL